MTLAVESGLSLRDLVDDEEARSAEMLATLVNYINERAKKKPGKRR